VKAVRLVQIGQPLEMQEIPMPAVGERDVLVRIRAAGICHSDVHYRAGRSSWAHAADPGHEIAGVVETTAPRRPLQARRSRLHPLPGLVRPVLLLQPRFEQFCHKGYMIGKHVDGGYAEYIAVSERNVMLLPPEISFEHGAAMMCSSSTSFHALRKARLQPGETVAVFGAGGLGMSAIQLARAWARWTSTRWTSTRRS